MKLDILRTILRRPVGRGIRYRIGGTDYFQRPLVLAQVEQLTELLGTVAIAPGTNAVGIVKLLGDRLADTLAIVLTPAGKEVEHKDLVEIARHLRYHIDLDTAAKVVEDFLFCNPISSIYNKLTGVMEKGLALLKAGGSAISSVSSPPAT